MLQSYQEDLSPQGLIDVDGTAVPDDDNSGPSALPRCLRDLQKRLAYGLMQRRLES